MQHLRTDSAVRAPSATASYSGRYIQLGGRGRHPRRPRPGPDWDDSGAFERRENDRALRTGARLFSAYDTPEGRLWIITEADRSSTCVLLPEEY